MRSMNDLLREYVEETLNEAARDIGNLALIGIISKTSTSYILWNPTKLAKLLVPHKSLPKEGRASVVQEDLVAHASDFMVGRIVLQPHRGEMWNAWEVISSAAASGYGPLMYDIAMSKLGRIAADRDAVTSQAESVWQYYLDKRPNIKHLTFDDVEDPRTPPKLDDAPLHGGEPGSSALDYAYEGASVDTAAAEARSGKALTSMAKALEMQPGALIMIFKDASSKFFVDMYGSRNR
jgi:hypothetical protein